MTKHVTHSMRKMLAGITLAGSLTLPFAGVAAANGDGGDRRATESTRTTETTRTSDGRATKPSTKGTTTVAGLQAVCQERIARRLTDLDRLEAKLATKADVLTPSHAAAIATIITDARTGLTALGTEIGAATTVEALQPLCARIVTDFRIYALRIPQAGLVLAADALIAKQATFATLKTKLETAIAAGSTPETAAALAALLTEFDEHVAAMVEKASTVADPVLALTPADYNADRAVLKPFVSTMKDARREAKLASKTARQILHLIAGDAEDEENGHGSLGGEHGADS